MVNSTPNGDEVVYQCRRDSVQEHERGIRADVPVVVDRAHHGRREEQLGGHRPPQVLDLGAGVQRVRRAGRRRPARVRMDVRHAPRRGGGAPARLHHPLAGPLRRALPRWAAGGLGVLRGHVAPRAHRLPRPGPDALVLPDAGGRLHRDRHRALLLELEDAVRADLPDGLEPQGHPGHRGGGPARPVRGRRRGRGRGPPRGAVEEGVGRAHPLLEEEEEDDDGIIVNGWSSVRISWIGVGRRPWRARGARRRSEESARSLESLCSCRLVFLPPCRKGSGLSLRRGRVPTHCLGAVPPVPRGVVGRAPRSRGCGCAPRLCTPGPLGSPGSSCSLVRHGVIEIFLASCFPNSALCDWLGHVFAHCVPSHVFLSSRALADIGHL
mmetsp:Transcript_94839/g.257419  ORF Transcript_94839/g.257419 Transcript_94839/m.257419 type:complete len:381 (+) Transcript_94839:1256-2398(+)